jgi:hypothetical protein
MIQFVDLTAPTPDLAGIIYHPDGEQFLALNYGYPTYLLKPGRKPVELTAIELTSTLLDWGRALATQAAPETEGQNPYLLTGDELARTEADRKAGR